MFFFFSSRRRHTRLQGDWSSDVCSSDLLAGALLHWVEQFPLLARDRDEQGRDRPESQAAERDQHGVVVGFPAKLRRRGDRKSTRLNSSHLVISYAVFCLKKKTNRSEVLH